MRCSRLVLSLVCAAATLACGDNHGSDQPDARPSDASVTDGTAGDASADASTDGGAATCADGDPDVTVPAHFCARVFANTMQRPRQMAVQPSGIVLVANTPSRDGVKPGSVIALRDADGDGHAEQTTTFGAPGGTGIAWRAGYVYVGEDDRIVRYPLPDGMMMPTGPAEVVVGSLPKSGDHPAKAIKIAPDGSLLVVIASETNSCQQVNRTPGSPGKDPCPELPTRAGVWKFALDTLNQTEASGTRIATGVRNATAFAVHPTTGTIITANNGRDELYQNWPGLYTADDDKILPSEELALLPTGVDRGWPYCYHDPRDNQMKLAPEYGGNAMMQGRCAAIAPPLLAIPAHWAALGMVFYTATTASAFPTDFRAGVFVAYHGSRFDPLGEMGVPGYSVEYIPVGATTAGPRVPFMTGLAGPDRPLPEAAKHRPVGVEVGPDGALYVSDDVGGRVWRVTYEP